MNDTWKHAVARPMDALRELLEESEESSIELAEKTGVSGSVIRNVRNGTVKDVRATTWGLLVRYLLEERERLGVRAA